jgi:hypothetical protein
MQVRVDDCRSPVPRYVEIAAATRELSRRCHEKRFGYQSPWAVVVTVAIGFFVWDVLQAVFATYPEVSAAVATFLVIWRALRSPL